LITAVGHKFRVTFSRVASAKSPSCTRCETRQQKIRARYGSAGTRAARHANAPRHFQKNEGSTMRRRLIRSVEAISSSTLSNVFSSPLAVT
jgi:hypothetical protein